jgi:hypothetical protein
MAKAATTTYCLASPVDVNKSSSDSDDDMLCWAAAASNLISHGGYHVDSQGAPLTVKQTFLYYEDHWTDQGGWAYYGLYWFMTGTNLGPHNSSWATVTSPGGNFYPELKDRIWHNNNAGSQAMALIDQQLHVDQSNGVTIGIHGTYDHFLTCWGFVCDESLAGTSGYYKSIIVTDSDDSYTGTKTYNVLLQSGKWYLQSYFGSSNCAITELATLPGLVPEPCTMAMLAFGGLAMLRRRRTAA